MPVLAKGPGTKCEQTSVNEIAKNAKMTVNEIAAHTSTTVSEIAAYAPMSVSVAWLGTTPDSGHWKLLSGSEA